MNDKNSVIKLKSATGLAKELNISSKDMFSKLESNGLIVRNGSVWDLTPKGKSKPPPVSRLVSGTPSYKGKGGKSCLSDGKRL